MARLHALLHEKRFQGPWRVLLAVLAGITAWFAFSPAPPGPAFDGADKLDHLLAFGSMATAGALAWPAGPRAAAGASAGLLAYGAFIELVQSQIPGRYADLADLLADAVGIAGGLVLAWMLRRATRPR